MDGGRGASVGHSLVQPPRPNNLSPRAAVRGKATALGPNLQFPRAAQSKAGAARAA